MPNSLAACQKGSYSLLLKGRSGPVEAVIIAPRKPRLAASFDVLDSEGRRPRAKIKAIGMNRSRSEEQHSKSQSLYALHASRWSSPSRTLNSDIPNVV